MILGWKLFPEPLSQCIILSPKAIYKILNVISLAYFIYLGLLGMANNFGFFKQAKQKLSLATILKVLGVTKVSVFLLFLYDY